MTIHKTTTIDGKTLAESYDLLGTSRKTVSQAGHGFLAGNWVKRSSGLYALAQADSAGNARAIGIVESVSPGSLPATTKLCLHCNGSSGSTSFPDASASAHTMTANGGAQVNITGPKFGSGSLYLDGNGDYLSTPDSADWDFGLGAFAIDFWMQCSTFPTYAVIMEQADDGNNFISIQHRNATGLLLYVFKDGGQVALMNQGTRTITDGSWHHIALSRSAANTFYFFIDGAQVATYSVGYAMPNLAADLNIGYGAQGGLDYFNGKLDEIRICKGTDNGWSGSTITIPTGEYGISDEFLMVMGGETQSGSYAFTDGNQHWLSPTVAGGIITTEPSTSGQIIKPLMIATGATSGIVQIGNGLVVP